MSRLAEELIIWASQPFGFVKLSDDYSTGSSIMPQKRNPDAAELVRGHSGRIVGALTALMVTMKGLPLAYSKDMQDDKEPVFEARDLLMLSLQALAGMIETVEFVPERMREAAASGYSTATDLADWLVREADVPFREAHHITGRAVKLAEERGCGLAELPLDDLQGDRSAHRPARVRRAQRRGVGRQPHQLRRHRAGAGPRADREGEGGARALGFRLPLRERAQAQRVQSDEPRRVALVVGAAAFLEGHQVLVVERMLALRPMTVALPL